MSTERGLSLSQASATALWYMTQHGGRHHGPVAPETAFELLRRNPRYGHLSDDQLRQAVVTAWRNKEYTDTFHLNTKGKYR